ncbi:MAG TPA: MFS transporter [Acidocella sp.]|jgi:predicted MFS family arabinose efflux permease|uniref:MFS transporter n=1 Tax=Acidocella sp. TaxID=50710 RepID=UPI002C414C42|nr:MFS transporter [Acidocella sp.]HVE20707.1 MFS transporter [Acidocella sp.]
MTISEKTAPSAAMVLLLAFACGIVVANIYYAQPLIDMIGPSVGLGPRDASAIVSLTQLGYAAGLLLLVPLGDLVENRLLVVLTIAASIPALLLAAVARDGTVMLVAAALIGLTSVAVQMLVPLAAHLSPEHMRGRVVGNVMSGLLVGILLARPVSSVIANFSGWRSVFLISAAVMLATLVLLRFSLPHRRPSANHHYGELLASLLALPVRIPLLRQRAAYQAAAFAGFSLFWTGVPLLLLHDFHYTQTGVALFALVGAAGALAAPLAGRAADRGHMTAGTVFALVSISLSFLVAFLGSWMHSVIVLALSGVLLDAGVQTNLVISQRSIYTLAPEIRSRLNGVFMAIFFVGGAAGSAITSPVFNHFGWAGLCVVGAVLPVLALGYFCAVRAR